MPDKPCLLTTPPMSESSRTSTDGGETDSLDVEDLFATEDTDVSIEESTEDRTSTPDDGATPDAEDTTADELFSQLRDEHAADEPAADAVTEESPEDIMAKADEEAAHVDQVDDAIRADEDALDDLLLTGRREADGFLWVETEDDAAADDGFGAMFEGADDADGSANTADGDAATADGDAATDADASDATTHDEPSADDAQSMDDAASSDDDFELSPDADHSFEDRALTFDDADDDSDGSDDLFEGDADADDEAASERDERDDVGGEAGDDDGPAGDDDGGGLADRIRSILSG